MLQDDEDKIHLVIIIKQDTILEHERKTHRQWLPGVDEKTNCQRNNYCIIT